jgi:signal transduction histidine kinase
LPPERVGTARALTSTAIDASAYVEEAARWTGATPASETVPLDPIVAKPSAARVLVADDNTDMREYIVRLLAEHWAVEAVADGAAAFDSARARPPDLLVADVMMPGLDGFELLRALRSEPLTATVPVILLSARAGEEARVEGLQAGADDYLTKPFSARELVARVASQLELTRIRRVAADRERVARAEAESANRAKDDFLAMLSHELRTPLTAVVGWTRILRRTTLDDKTLRQALDAIDRNTRTQVQLIDDLLDVSRIVAGKLDLERQPVHVPSVIKASIESLAEAAERKRITIQQALDATGGVVVGDEMRLAQVVTNLVGNAVKFTPEGGHVLVSLEDTGPELILTVQDDGIGIAAEDLPRVFDRFHQGTLSRRGGGGLGLGLAIVQHLVKVHGGRITVESEGADRGTRFSVYFPRLAGQEVVRRDRRAEGDFDVTGLDVLVVEDNPDSREMISQLLRSSGATVREVDGAEAALEMLARQVPDVLVSDIGLAGLDGFGLIRRVRALPGPARDVPAIAVTAYARAEDRAAALAAGYQRYLTKPIEPSDLRAALAGVIEGKRRGGTGRSAR